MYSGLAWPKLAAMLRTLSAYGLAARMRSCALRILDTEIISMALVIFFVLSKFLILPRISLPVAIKTPSLVTGVLSEGLFEGCGRGVQFGFGVFVHGLVGFKLGQQRSVFVFQVAMQAVLKRQQLVDCDIVQVALVHGKQRGAHQGNRQRTVLGLLEQFSDTGTALQLLAGGFVQIGGELRERRQLTVLGQVGTDTARQVLDQLGLGSTTDARHRNTGVNGRADTRVEQRGLQKDLAVGN